MMEKWRSRIRHWLGWNRGSVMSWTTTEGRILMGFMCECGVIHSVHDTTHLIDGMLKRSQEAK